MKCPNCDFESPPEMRFCGMCGTALTRTCPACQYVNPITYRFCGMCGTALEGSDVIAPSYSRFTAPVENVLRQPAAVIPQSTIPPGTGVQGVLQSVPALEGERRVATILFADVKGSTELLERLGTEAWVETMNNMFQVLESEIYRYHGEVGQFRGDGLVAFFGAKSADEDDPQHAVMAALAIQEAIKPFAADLARRAGVELIMRVGINTGEIIVANVGDSKYSEDTAMGEALAVAARMETSAEPGTVLVSESTYRLTHEEFEWQPLGEIHVKGISYPIQVYRPLRRRPSSELDQDAQPLPGDGSLYRFAHRMIGRKAEYKQLRKFVDDLATGRGSIALVTGVKGMGKSYLVNQVRQHFARQNVLYAAAQSLENPSEGETTGNRPILWLRARCRSYSTLRPYSMWLDLMHEWVGAHPEDHNDAVNEVFRTQIELQRGSDVEHDYPNLATFMSAPSEETAAERSKHLDAESLKRVFFKTVRDWIKGLAERGPLVISFADMQWSDTTSIELLEYCLPLVDTHPVLWILVYRQERSSPVWEMQHRLETEYPHRLTHLNIPPLSTQETESFIDQVLGPDALQPETRELITRKAEGNPYFIRELIYSLIAQGALVFGEDGLWRQTRSVTSLDLPDSLQGLLMARIDRLAPTERRVLQMAAVIGSVFWYNLLQSLAAPSISEKQLQTAMVSLQRTGLVHERGLIDDLGMEYAFDSSLIREVAYESLLNTQRVNHHLRVAEYLEEIVFREGKRRYFNTLAHHYKMAGDSKKELFYSLQAADRAQSIYANAEALHYYTRALELLNQMEAQHQGNSHQHYAILTQKFEALNGRRAVHFLMGNMQAGYADAQALLPLARQMEQDPTWLIDALLQQPGVSSAESRAELLAGVPLAQEALELAQRIGDKRREMNALLAIAGQRNLLNDLSWIEVGDRALALSREIGDRHYEAMILLALGHAYVGRDELQRGLEYLNAALPICQSLDDRVAEMILLRVLGSQYERSGDHYKRLVDFEQKRLEIARQIGDRFEEGNTLNFCGQIQALNLGDYEGGLVHLRESEKILDAVSGKIFTQLRIAQVQIALGQFDDAQKTLEEAHPVAERNVYDLGRVGLKLVTILLYNALGGRVHLENVNVMAQEIIDMENSQLISRQYRMAAACEASIAQLGLARLASDPVQRDTHNRKALEYARSALDIYEWFGYVNIIECCSEEIYLRYSQALTTNGRTEEASKFLEMAYDEMMRKYEMIPPDSPFRRTFLENIAIHRDIRAGHTSLTLAQINNFRGVQGTDREGNSAA